MNKKEGKIAGLLAAYPKVAAAYNAKYKKRKDGKKQKERPLIFSTKTLKKK